MCQFFESCSIFAKNLQREEGHRRNDREAEDAAERLPAEVTRYGEVSVAGRAMTIVVTSGGVATLPDQKLAEVVTAFRGH